MGPKQQKNTDEEYVSLTQVNDLLNQQKDMFTALLQQQQDIFKNFVKVILDSTNSRLDAITKEVQDLKSSIQFTQKDVDELKITQAKQSDHCNIIQTDIMKLCESLQVILDKQEYLEGQSRRNKIVIDGIPEAPGESWADSEEKVKDMLKKKLQLQREIEVERAHRTGKPEAARERPRSIVVKFLRFKDKAAVLQRAKNLKGTKIFINEDYADAVRLKRKELIPKMKAAHEKGDIAYLRHDRLIIHPRTSTPC
ncbi:uncharacterized protein LOC126388379 [Epinephelus moara]|uniref:uncharacterized protein LOC126388379 n=1 Tax=Epinephelus moara TaxID=300413 RepID=UPI00214E41B4|nr:uncharacterized protein LOC126388379 [Epinephelus moara]